MNAQEQFWSGEFGDAYLQRNRVAWQARIPFWKAMIDATGARSVFEFGCNAGWNLSAIRRAYADVQVRGTDINPIAASQAITAGLSVCALDEAPRSELVFTAGVLIHIAPEFLVGIMTKLIAKSTDYVLAVEYGAATEREVNYRGHSERLWKRNFGSLYMDMGLELVQKGPAGKGFDDCTYWLLRKPVPE
jgi:pseudaminic acid biosynthesis-associated methylase